MAKRELPPAALAVAQAVAAALPDGDVVVGCSGGADSTALALGAAWAAGRRGARATAVIVDHGLQPGSVGIAREAAARLGEHGVDARIVAVRVAPSGEGLEAAAREARLAALADQRLPVLLGHTLDDQAESVLLGLLRGSGTRSLAGMAEVRGPFVRPLLALRRSDTEQACRDWGIDWWRDPMNDDDAFARVRARGLLREVATRLGRDVAPALARTATLARADADALDALAEAVETGEPPETARIAALEGLPDALRWRVLHRWMARLGVAADQGNVLAVDALLTRWRGQSDIAVPGGSVRRVGADLRFTRGAGRNEPR